VGPPAGAGFGFELLSRAGFGFELLSRAGGGICSLFSLLESARQKTMNIPVRLAGPRPQPMTTNYEYEI
jgi:hypothetical protein